jgi:hypothetical protein
MLDAVVLFPLFKCHVCLQQCSRECSIRSVRVGSEENLSKEKIPADISRCHSFVENCAGRFKKSFSTVRAYAYKFIQGTFAVV